MKTDKVKRFGGELELSNVEVKNSTYEAREDFFLILHQQKPQVFNEVTALFNFNSLPDSLRNDEPAADYLTNFFLRNLESSILLKYEWSKADFKESLAQTPLVFYFDYLSQKKPELERFKAKYETKIKKRGWQKNDERANVEAVKALIPDWKTLEQDSQAEDLCKSLIDWANRYNICENWILDFVLINLRKLKEIIDKVLLSIAESIDDFQILFYEFESHRSNAFGDALASYRWGASGLKNPFKSYMELDGYPIFKFNELEIKIEDRWMPFYTTRQQFIERVELEFFSQLRRKLNCIYESAENLDFLLKDLSQIKTLSSQFRKHLKDYCVKVRKIQPKGSVETPQKNSGIKHFQWLIDFQINHPVEMTYEDLAEKNNTDNKAIRSGIKSISEILGLSLRDAPRTGRPKGIKETRKRHIANR